MGKQSKKGYKAKNLAAKWVNAISGLREVLA